MVLRPARDGQFRLRDDDGPVEVRPPGRRRSDACRTIRATQCFPTSPMYSTTTPSPSPFRRVGRTVAALAIAGLVLGACSSDDDPATEDAPAVHPTVTPSTSAPSSPSNSVPTTVAAPTTSTQAPPPTSPPTTTDPAPTTTQPDPARVALLDGVLSSHYRAGEFVGARIALMDSDGTITEATAGTQTTDSASPPVDLDVPWNIGSLTKTFVAVVV